MAQKGYIKNSVTADLGAPELAAIFKGLLPTNGIINLWDDLACARVNDNLVRLSPGVYNLSGYLLGVMQGTTADLVVDSGTAGYNRIDLVVAEFVRNGGGAGVDTLQFKVVKGTSTTGTPADPTLTADDINVEANTTRQEALYRLTITGTTMADPELMASVLDNLTSVVAMLALKAPLASPALTGTPTVPTAAVGTNTTQVASTAFVRAQIPLDAPLDLLAEYEVTGSAVTSIDFSGLDINTHKSYRVEIEIINATATPNIPIYCFVNNDIIVTNYYRQLFYGTSTTVGAARTNTPEITNVAASIQTSTQLNVSKDFNGNVRITSVSAQGAASGVIIATYACTKIATVTNITQLTFTAGTANSIAVGSKIRIYRGDV